MKAQSNFLLPKRAFRQLSGGSEDWLKKQEVGPDPVPFPVVRSWFQQSYPELDEPRIIAHVNLRGGIGKTTSSINLAVRLSQYGRKTALIDLDPQASATLALRGSVDEDDLIFLDVWQKSHALADAVDVLHEGLLLLPSSLGNGLLDVNLNNPRHQKTAVSTICNNMFNELDTDCIVIDCPPALGAAVISTICAVTDLVIPVMGDPFSVRGLQLTLDEIDSICETFGLQKPAVHILFNRMDRREKLIVDTYEKLQDEYNDLLVPFPIRTSSKIDRTYATGDTLFSNHTRSKAYKDFDAYTRYLIGLPTTQ